jgi:Phosphodiester glycosidase
MKNQSNSSQRRSRRSFLFLAGAALTSIGFKHKPAIEENPGELIQVKYGVIANVPFYRTSIDLQNSNTLLTVGLANNPILGQRQSAKGNEPFENMVRRYRASLVVNGAFFGKQAPFPVLGNVVCAGEFIQHNPLKNLGTTFAIAANNKPKIITSRTEALPEWKQYWLSLTAGPRLLKNGKIWLAPRSEGFSDPKVMGIAPRLAIGFPASGNPLILVTFLKPISLLKEAKLMRAIGCSEAMNLDGGSSMALSHQGKILISPQRPLTNAIVAYDNKYPAPIFLQQAWERFRYKF